MKRINHKITCEPNGQSHPSPNSCYLQSKDVATKFWQKFTKWNDYDHLKTLNCELIEQKVQIRLNLVEK